MFGHDYKSLPVARCVEIGWDGEQLAGTVEFIPADVSPEAEKAFQLVKSGFLRSCSVGFNPISDPKGNPRGGSDYPLCELLEVSLVPVGANAAALAKSLGSAGASRELTDEEASEALAAAVTRKLAKLGFGPGRELPDEVAEEYLARCVAAEMERIAAERAAVIDDVLVRSFAAETTAELDEQLLRLTLPELRQFQAALARRLMRRTDEPTNCHWLGAAMPLRAVTVWR